MIHISLQQWPLYLGLELLEVGLLVVVEVDLLLQLHLPPAHQTLAPVSEHVFLKLAP